MNEINNQSLGSGMTRTISTSAKPESAKRQNSVAESGDKLPVNETSSAKVRAQQQSQLDSVSTKAPAKEDIKEAVAKMNEYTQSIQRDIQFSLDDTSGRTVVTVIDRESKEMIRQIPDATFLEMARNLNNYVETRSDSGAVSAEEGVLQLIRAQV